MPGQDVVFPPFFFEKNRVSARVRDLDRGGIPFAAPGRLFLHECIIGELGLQPDGNPAYILAPAEAARPF